jgi:hypothetical protein
MDKIAQRNGNNRPILDRAARSSTYREVGCDAVRITERCRKDMGNLQALADSIAAEGLLQPIGITEDCVLVFGLRRLIAVRDILRRPTIPALVVNVSSIVNGEYMENEIRKDFTASERVAIGKAIEEVIGNRRGQRTDLQLPQNFAEIETGVETREIAAQKAGFGNRTTYAQACKVVEQAGEELIARMDAEEIAVSSAALVADEPLDRQREIAAMPRAEQQEAIRKLRRKDLPTPDAAHRRAMETGLAILDRNLDYQLPVSREKGEHSLAVMAVIDAIRDLARCALTPADAAAGILEFDTPDMDFAGQCRKATSFLEDVTRNLDSHAKQ